eukprot:CAMPEP_0113937854 /NCGR_PEP_ID=MMETSP1339-20121228/4368_1 /TAXON_ID=94617 /ORGANISM="Fibrocapsa japonica" /LENGTH=101 /DNA_ID=CAMNT_0000940761 /DNA_START=216 /DNA_END=518 /DNA_ORIENTATION=+ /assembly_acc=CAM_ASM_000762
MFFRLVLLHDFVPEGLRPPDVSQHDGVQQVLVVHVAGLRGEEEVRQHLLVAFVKVHKEFRGHLVNGVQEHVLGDFPRLVRVEGHQVLPQHFLALQPGKAGA